MGATSGWDSIACTGRSRGKALFQMLGVFAEFERSIIQERIAAGIVLRMPVPAASAARTAASAVAVVDAVDFSGARARAKGSAEREVLGLRGAMSLARSEATLHRRAR
jgi:hypothetical protein